MNISAKKKPSHVASGELKWDVRQRLAMLEATALWEGRVTTPVLTRLFGISRGQASKDFSLYHQLAPNNLAYDLNQKAYFPTDHFHPCFIRGTADEYLRLIEAGHELGQSVTLPIMPAAVSVELMRLPERRLDLQLLRVVNQAIREKRQLAVTYQSMSREPRVLLLEPHTLIYTGYRWHVRAFSHEHGEFRDFVLARFLSSPEFREYGQHFKEEDSDWDTWETWIIAPNPGLGAEQQAVIADDYGMVDGTLQLDVRKALALYYLRMLHLDGDEAVIDPKVNQIVLTARIQRAPSS